MKRTGFKPKAPPPRPARQWEGEAPAMTPARATLQRSDGKARMVVPVPKRPAVRSKALREAYRQLPCQFIDSNGYLCGRQDGTVCCCHSNWGEHGKGMARKADDSRGASGCSQCHAELDQGHRWDADEKRLKWQGAHERSVRLLVSMGLWPSDIPIPTTGDDAC